MTADEPQPIACTLLGDALRDRLAWIAALMHDALEGSEHDDRILRLRFAPEAVRRVQDMVHKERACCGFLTFELDQRPHELRLTIKAPETAREAADALFVQFTASASLLP